MTVIEQIGQDSAGPLDVVSPRWRTADVARLRAALRAADRAGPQRRHGDLPT